MRLKKSFTAHMSIILSLAMVFTTPMQAVPVMAAPIVENDILEQEPDIIMDDIETGKDDGVLYEDTKDGINKEEELLGAEDVLEPASAGGDDIGTADDSADLLDSSDDDLVIGNEGENAKYPVVFHDYYGESLKTVQVNMGTVIAQEQIPDDETNPSKLAIDGCAFEGWSVKTEEVGENDLFDTKNTLIYQAYALYPVYSSKVNASFANPNFDATYGDIVSENNNKLEITPIKNETKYIHGDYTPIFSSGDEDVAVGLLDYGVLAVSTNGGYETKITASVNSVFGTYLGEATYQLKVNKKDLTVSAGNAVKVYDGTPLSENSYTFDGLAVAKLEGATILEDVIDDITITGGLTEVGESVNKANVTKIVRKDVKGTDVTANYNIKYIDGILEVTPKDLTLEWSGEKSYEYDGEVHKPTVSATNVVSGDEVKLDVLVYKKAGETVIPVTGPKDKGFYVAVAELESIGDNKNYALSANTTFEYEITEAKINCEVTSYNGVYDKGYHSIAVSVNKPDGCTITYRTDEASPYTEGNPKFKDVGKYTVYYLVEKDNYKPFSGNSTVTITKADMHVSGNDVTVSYDGKAHYLSIDGIPEDEDASVYYGDTEGSYTENEFKKTNIGSWKKYFKVTASNYNDAFGSATLTITGVPATVTKEPTAKEGTISYNGSDQELFNEGGSDTGIMFYCFAKTKPDYDSGNWNQTMPKGTDAGTYNLYYYAGGDDNHTRSTISGPVVKEIEKAIPKVTAPVSANDLTYNTNEQDLITTAGTTDGGTLMYAAVKWDGTEPKVLSKNDAGWSDKLPKGTDAGTYRVFWYVKGNDNYKDVDPSAANKVDTVIKKADPKLIPAPVSANNLTYNGLSQNLLEIAGKADGGTLKYKMGGGDYSTTVPFATKAGVYTVTYKVFGNKNYNDSTEASLNIWIAKKPVTISVNTATYVYGNKISAENFTISMDGFVDGDGPIVYDNGDPLNYCDPQAGTPTKYVPYRYVTVILGEGSNKTQFRVEVQTDTWLPWNDYKDAGTYNNFIKAYKENNTGDPDPLHKLDNYSLPTHDEDFFGDLVVNKADILLDYIDPKPKANEGLSYNGYPHNLVSAGNIDAKYGQLMYSADYTPATEYKPASGENTFSAELPKKTNAGEYNVYYKVKGSKNYNDSKIFEPVKVKINTADSKITHPAVANVELYFNNKEQELLSQYAEADNGTILYYVDSTGKGAPAKDSPAWTQTPPKAINAGKYKVYYYCKGATNYSDFPNESVKGDYSDYPYASVEAYIYKAQLRITANDATVVYGDPWDDEFTASIEAVHGVYNPADFELLGIKYDKATGNAVGTYKVMPRMVYNPVNYEVYDGEGYVYGTLTITPAPLTVKADDQYKNYGDTDPELTYTVTGLKYNDTKDVLTNVSIKRAEGEDAGTYPITISGDKIAGNENYNPVTYENGTFVIGRSDVLITVLPEAKDLTYDGTEQELVKAGNAFGVDNEPLDFMYSEDYAYDPTTNTVTNSGNWVNEIPTQKNVGTYPVWWKVVSGNYIETDPAPLSVTIKARPFRLDPEVAVSQNLVYDKTVQNLVNESVIKNLVSENDLKIEYRVGGDGTWSTVIPSAKDAGEYDIYYRVNVDDENTAKDPNYEVIDVTGPLKAQIAPRSFTIEPAVSANTYIYDKAKHDLDLTNTSTVGNIIAGDTVELMYRVGLTGEWSKDVPTATNVGKYPIYYRVNVDDDNQTLDTNYEVQEITGPLNAEIYINQSVLDTAPEAKLGLVYKAISQNLVSAGKATNGKVMYADLNHALAEGETITNWSEEVPYDTNAGTHYIYYMVKGDYGYADVAQAGPLTVTIAKAAAPKINNAEATLLRSEGKENLYERITFAEGTQESWYDPIKYSLAGSDSVARLEGNTVWAKSQTGIVTAKIEIPEKDNTFGTSAEIKITVKGQNEGGESGDEPVEDGELKVWLADVDTQDLKGTEYYALTYTGEPIKPEVIVKNGSKVLVPGTDYSVAYQNNKEANVTYDKDDKLAEIDKKKHAKVIITGKGNYSTKKEIEFLIVAKNINDEDVYVGNTVCEYNKKLAPVITYMGKVVNKKNYTYEPTDNRTEDGSAKIKGTGNFYGERVVEYTVKVKSELKEFKVRLANVDNIYYNGDAKKLDPESQLIVSDKSTGLQIDPENYIVSYGDNVNAGTVNVYVIGTGLYKGSVKKTFKIRPAKYATFTITNATELATTGYPYSSLGVTPEPYLSAKIDEEHDEVSLVLGRDYTVTYKDNKKVGSGMVNIKFKGNYQGAPKLSQSFKITRAKMTEDNCKVILAKSLVYNSAKPKASNYFVKKNKNLFVELNGVMLKSGDYEVSFWHDGEEREEELTKDSKIKAGETITVKIKANPKSDKYVTPEGADIKAEYVVTEVPSGGIDISKAKVSVVNSAGRKKSVGYTGKAITFPIEYPENIKLDETDLRYLQVVVKVGNKNVTYTEKPDNREVSKRFEVSYVNNVRKGTATVIITPKDESFSGSAVGTFKIDSSIFKTFLESLLDERNL